MGSHEPAARLTLLPVPTRYAGPLQHTHSTLGRPAKLTPEVAATIEELAPLGLPSQSIAHHVGVTPGAISQWIAAARTDQATELHKRVAKAILNSQIAIEKRCLAKVIESEDTKDAQWLLTHIPRLRAVYSEGAAERRAVTQAMAAVAKGIEQANLPPDQALALMHHIQAQGIKLPGDEAEG